MLVKDDVQKLNTDLCVVQNSGLHIFGLQLLNGLIQLVPPPPVPVGQVGEEKPRSPHFFPYPHACDIFKSGIGCVYVISE
jgi:hypothetical protein